MTRPEDIKLFTLKTDVCNPIKHLTFDYACSLAKEFGITLGAKKFTIAMED